MLGQKDGAGSSARQLGFAWGVGHGTSLFLLGLPVVLFRAYLPHMLPQAAELAVALIIIALALRLLLRWHRGYFHAHIHVHEGVPHIHPHLHEHARKARHPEEHRHRHSLPFGRSPAAAWGIGLVHGIGGSAGAGILLVSASPTASAGVLALVLFALGTTLSMTVLTALLGRLLAQPLASRNLRWIIPAMGVVSLGFGVWYGLAAVPA